MAFTNRNTCKNFTLAGGLTKVQLSASECTEIMFSIPAAGSITLYSESDSTTGFVVAGPATATGGSTVFTYSGLSNASELSASTTGTCYYRTKYFANYNLAVQM